MEKIVEVVKLKQVIMETEYNTYSIKSPRDASSLVSDLIGDDDRETFLVIGLNTKNEINIISRAHTGSINASIVSVRETMKPLILANCISYIAAHNHPSGRNILDPSRDDIHITEKLFKAGQLLDIELLDHLIVSGKRCISLKAEGFFDRFKKD